jgi:hypothetical protein
VIVRALIIALAAAALAAGGCGGGDDGRLSKAEWVAQADRICKRVNDRLEKTEQPETMAELVTVLDQGLKDVDDAVADLRELEPPEEMEEDVDAWLAKVEAASAQIENALDAAKDQDEEELSAALEEGTRVNEEGNGQARELGLKECAEE